ncbi:hypothetical protein LLS1_14490 [Leifsonia sp. LS1]|uniref:hypothetical protein n=1 Tax=Leifsonia sp. LS1 TaxID=2828483 RepID=UPI001CFEFEBE|nr:hypothetical protein [Leifsonia sp. LS1]GIT79780.1 hypothetical protein LLS1_14490 [Leifsonia sp. LS1]
MRAIGDLEIIAADTSFQADSPTPAQPGSKSSFVEAGGVPPARSDRSGTLDAQAQLAVDVTLMNARAQYERVPSSTTGASLAQALEASGQSDDAIAMAEQVLGLCARDASGALLDPAAARICLEMLIRLDLLDKAVEFSHQLPIDPHTQLVIGAAVVGTGDFAAARELIAGASVDGQDAVLGYLLVSEGNDAAAVAKLRAALRRAPDDADSAHNLSIALWRLGSRRKAIAAALQATRSAPGRVDVSLHYLELLLECKEFDQTKREVSRVLDRGVSPTSRLLIIQARAFLGQREFGRAEPLFARATQLAKAEADAGTLAEVQSNLARLRVVYGKVTNDEAIRQLVRLHDEHPAEDVVVANLAQVSVRKRHAAVLRNVFSQSAGIMSPARAAFVEYQLATLEGDNDLAIEKSLHWLELEPSNNFARSAALVALGIGSERWGEAAEIAQTLLEQGPSDPLELNNLAYIFAMAGMPERSIKLLADHADESFVLKATLGLAYLALADIDRGMKLYRQAADEADERGDGNRSLMTLFQALVVRQLGILDSNDNRVIEALSLPPVALPDDWRDRPEFLRVYGVVKSRNYPWPLSI